MGKCKGIGGETAVTKMAHVGVRTRARVLAAAGSTSAARRRKVGGGELNFSSSLIPLRSRRRVVVTPQKTTSVSPAASGNSRRQTISNSHCSSAGSDRLPASCCSSSASSEVANNMFNVVDLEEENVQKIQTSTCSLNSDERRETTASSEVQVESGDLESTARPSEANSRRRSSAAKMPSEIELEEFFAAAEKDTQKRFREKYNYDIVKDVPLEGRYEWVRLKP